MSFRRVAKGGDWVDNRQSLSHLPLAENHPLPLFVTYAILQIKKCVRCILGITIKFPYCCFHAIHTLYIFNLLYATDFRRLIEIYIFPHQAKI